MNVAFRAKGWMPVYTASPYSRIVLVGQAPGRIAQQTHKPWNDASGRLLRQWLGVSDEQFYNPDLFALMPMDFYYLGKGVHGDLPPRNNFAAMWHPRLLERMPYVRLIILVGTYAQKYYLAGRAKKNVTATCRLVFIKFNKFTFLHCNICNHLHYYVDYLYADKLKTHQGN